MTSADVVAITDISQDAAGAIVLWRLSGDTNLDKLRAAFAAHGIDEKLLPETPSPETALRRAVKEHEDKRMLVRPLPGKRAAYALVTEHARAEEEAAQVQNALEYSVLLTVRLAYNGDDGAPNLEFSYADDKLSAIAADIRSTFTVGMDRVTSNDTVGWLCDMVRHVKAVPLRDTGGVYFVPRQTLPLWRKIAASLRSASATYVAEIPALKSSEAVDTILDSLQREADQFLGTMEEELRKAADAPDGMGSRAIKTRIARCDASVEKLSIYEKLLGVRLDKVRDRVGALQANLAAAALIAHAQEDA